MRPSAFIGELDPDIAYQFDCAAFQASRRASRAFPGGTRPAWIKHWN